MVRISTSHRMLGQYPKVGDAIWNDTGTESGTVVGFRRCQLEDCGGTCFIVRWPDGRRTVPCEYGLVMDEQNRILIGGRRPVTPA